MMPMTIRITPMALTSRPATVALTPQTRIAPPAISSKLTAIPKRTSLDYRLYYPGEARY